jgi:protoheme IX farnesyltransferase
VSATTLARGRTTSVLADVVALTKPRVLSLLVATGICGYLAAARGDVHLGALLAVAGGGVLAAGGANALNCVLDRDIDAEMARTRTRPIPGGRMPVAVAAALGVAMNLAAAAWLLAAAGMLAAVLALSGTAWYLAVYTIWLKRRSASNIVIGGAAGCFPPLVGWAAATGRVDATAIALAAVIFLWTPPHFWALATLLRNDYQRARIPMLPAIGSVEVAARRGFAYANATVAASLAPVAWGGAGLGYVVAAAALGSILLMRADAFRRAADRATAVRLFTWSIAYLAALFLVLVIDRTVGA